MHIRMRLNRMTLKVNAIIMYVNHTIMIQLQCALSPLDNALHDRSYLDFSTIFVVITWPDRSLINHKNYKRDRELFLRCHVGAASIFSVISGHNRLIKPNREMRNA